MTLAQYVQRLREKQGWTQQALADRVGLPPHQIRDIESGIELYFSPSIRQKLARVLKTRPQDLKALEKPNMAHKPFTLSEGAREQWTEELLHFPNQTHHCPACQAPLIVRLFERRDLEENPILEVKAHCSACLFKL